MKNEKAAGKATPDLQHIFTAYVLRAVQNSRYDYICRQKKRLQWESLLEESWHEIETDYSAEFEKVLPLQMQLGNDRLLVALKELTVREQSIFLDRVLAEMSFSALASKFGMSCAGAASAYYRAIRKLREKMEERD